MSDLTARTPVRLAGGTLVAALASTLLAADAARAQSSPYYLTDGDADIAYIVQNGALVQSFTTARLQYPIAVLDTVRIADRDDGVAREYTLAGVPTGTTWNGNNAFTQMLDGGTDAVQYNYAVECCGSVNSVVRTDLTWQGSTALFTLPDEEDGTSITYDTSTGRLFVSLFQSNTVREFDLAGNELSAFASPTAGELVGLAYEQSTDTLWGMDNSTDELYQLSKTGTVLDSFSVPGFSPSNVYGGEMPIVPEPAALATLGLACGSLLLRRRRPSVAG